MSKPDKTFNSAEHQQKGKENKDSSGTTLEEPIIKEKMTATNQASGLVFETVKYTEHKEFDSEQFEETFNQANILTIEKSEMEIEAERKNTEILEQANEFIATSKLSPKELLGELYTRNVGNEISIFVNQIVSFNNDLVSMVNQELAKNERNLKNIFYNNKDLSTFVGQMNIKYWIILKEVVTFSDELRFQVFFKIINLAYMAFVNDKISFYKLNHIGVMEWANPNNPNGNEINIFTILTTYICRHHIDDISHKHVKQMDLKLGLQNAKQNTLGETYVNRIIQFYTKDYFRS